jgi:hypothetical protein
VELEMCMRNARSLTRAATLENVAYAEGDLP